MKIDPNTLPAHGDWQSQFSHPHLSGSVSLSPETDPAAARDGASAPLGLHLHLQTNHPLLQKFLAELGPIIGKLLPILAEAAIAGSLGATAPAPPSN